ncbi:hypothetical protein JW826_00390 [Candidatus Woesearchaeota archaeon]|nr:hypothetical protein [Candidatus Woesearchaeota archaeon]
MENQTKRYERYAPSAANLSKDSKPEGKHNLPLKKFRVGAISATVWENHSVNDQGQPVAFKNVNFERSYKDAKGEWQTTTALRTGDLPKAILVLNKAYEFVLMNGSAAAEE